MPTTDEQRPRTKFRCESANDFNERAKNLASLLNVGIDESRATLAQLYGFSGIDELFEDLRDSERSPTTHPRGPYEEDDIFAPDIDGGILSVKRGNYSLYLAASLASCTIATMPMHLWDIREMGLFCRLKQHRVLFNKIRAKLAITNPKQVVQPELDPTPNAYAFPDRTSCGETVLAFTAKGAAIYELLIELSDTAAHDERRYLQRLKQLRARFPKNPWVGSKYVEFVVYRLQNMVESGELDVAGKRLAKSAFDCAKETICQFDTLIGNGCRTFPEPKLLVFSGPHGGDSYYYPASLYWGAIAAKATGDLDTAEKWLTKLLEFGDSDYFGANAALARIDSRRGSQSKPFNR